MRARFAVFALLVACGDDGNMYPVGGGGNDGGFGFGDGNKPVDAHLVDSTQSIDGTPAAVDAALLMGRVCLANDPRALHTCASTGAGGLTVRLGSNVTTTNADGTFTIPATTGTWRVTGSNIVTSIMNLADYEIPAITRTSYDAMIAGSLTSGMLNPGEGAIMVQAIHDGHGQAGATASSTPTSQYVPRYDSASQTVWSTDATTGTGTNGTIWLAGIDVGTASVTVDTATANAINVGGLPIVDGAITFTTVIFP
jgi:hypothetical protein